MRWRMIAATAWGVSLAVGSLLSAQTKHALGTTGPWHGVIHVTCFAGTAIVLGVCGSTRGGRMGLAGLGLGIGILMELMQRLFYGNDFEYVDVAYDGIGVVMGWMVLEGRIGKGAKVLPETVAAVEPGEGG